MIDSPLTQCSCGVVVVKRDAAKIEQEHLADLFAELSKAYEANDEARAILLKSEIDRIKEQVIKRDQAKQAKKLQKQAEKAEKAKAKEEKKAAKPKKSGGTTNGGADHAKPKVAKAPKTTAAAAAKTTHKKPIDTPETIAVKLERCYLLKPSKLLNPPVDTARKCLVLDIDYTLFDHKWQPQVKAEHRSDLKQMIPHFKRPYLHQFLETCNSKYDIFIWSATGMPAIDNKCTNLGIYTNTNYKVTAVLCKDHMIHVTKPRKAGRTADETVKPLSVIWRLFPQYYGSHNTIHVDDMICNFQLNPGNGIHILPYKESSVNPGDTELVYLTRYLMMIADSESDFTTLQHKKWKEYLIDRLWGLQSQYAFPDPVLEPIVDRTFLVQDSKDSAKGGVTLDEAPPRPSTPALLPEPALVAAVAHPGEVPVPLSPRGHSPILSHWHHLSHTSAHPSGTPTSPPLSPTKAPFSPFAVQLAQPQPDPPAPASGQHGSPGSSSVIINGPIVPEPHVALASTPSSSPKANSGPLWGGSTPPLTPSSSQPQLHPTASPSSPTTLKSSSEILIRRSPSDPATATNEAASHSAVVSSTSTAMAIPRSSSSGAIAPAGTPPNESSTWIRSSHPKLSIVTQT